MVDTKARFPRHSHENALEAEGARKPSTPPGRQLSTGALAIHKEDNCNPYMRMPEKERKRSRGQRTDLRKLSAWIKMMRAMEEAKKQPADEEE